MDYQPILSISNGTLVGSAPCLEGHRIQPGVDMPRAGIFQLAGVGNPTTFLPFGDGFNPIYCIHDHTVDGL